MMDINVFLTFQVCLPLPHDVLVFVCLSQRSPITSNEVGKKGEYAWIYLQEPINNMKFGF